MNMKQKTNTTSNQIPAKEFAVALLLKKAEAAHNRNPEDSPLGLITGVLTKLASKGQLSISKKDFESIYSSFATKDSYAAKVFAPELDIKKTESTRKLAGWTDDSKGPSAEGCYDEKIKNSLSELWDSKGKFKKEAGYKEFDSITASNAKSVTHLELTRLGIEPAEVEVIAGHNDFVLCKASYLSPKGLCGIVVPVQIAKKSSAMIPSCFATQYGFVALEANAVENYLTKIAGKNYVIDVKQIFDDIKLNKQADLLDEFAITVLAAQDDLLKKEAKQNTSKEPISYRMPEADSFEKKLSSVGGYAEFNFGKHVVDSGRDKIASKLEYLGYKSQIKVSSSDNNYIMYAVGIDTKAGKLGFEVMAEVEDGKVNIPSIIAVEDRVFDFNYSGLEKLVNHKASNSLALAKVSPMYELESSQILGNVKTASDKNDLQHLEEALTVLSEKGDEKGYVQALTEYMNCINKSACKKEECSCSKVIKIAGEHKPYCGHLFKPLDEVTQDENGVCITKLRKRLAETEQKNCIVLNTSKIVFS